MQLGNRSYPAACIALAARTGAELHFMAGDKDKKGGSGKVQATKPRDPEWAAGIKRLYDSVVDEPLPDSFKDLLSKLDSND